MRKLTTGQLKKKLDSAFSRRIRLDAADENGNCQCYTCKNVFHWKKIQNGHYVPRNHMMTRWHNNNCRPQCVGCNMYGNGKILDFRENLTKELGEEKVREVESARHSVFKPAQTWDDFYLEQIEIETERYKQIAKEKGIEL